MYLKGHLVRKKAPNGLPDRSSFGSRWDTGYRRGCMNATASGSLGWLDPQAIPSKSNMLCLFGWILGDRVGETIFSVGGS